MCCARSCAAGWTPSRRRARRWWAAIRSTVRSPSTGWRGRAGGARRRVWRHRGGGGGARWGGPRGLAVPGVVDPAAVLTNAGGREGDALVLTKPLGAGAVATALKRGRADSRLVARAVEVMSALNDVAGAQARAAGASALTDVTGFGLLGHTHELAAASGLAAEIRAEAVPTVDGVLELLSDESAVAGGSRRNRADAETFTAWDESVPEPRRRLVCDGVPSGGLLAAVPPARAGEIAGWVVGRLVSGPAGAIRVG